MFKTTLIAFALTTGMTTAALAQQDNIDVSAGSDVRTASVNIGDLNLTTLAGQSALRARLNVAANQVCNFGASRFDIDTACAYDAKRDAATQATAAIDAAANGKVAMTAISLRAAR